MQWGGVVSVVRGLCVCGGGGMRPEDRVAIHEVRAVGCWGAVLWWWCGDVLLVVR